MANKLPVLSLDGEPETFLAGGSQKPEQRLPGAHVVDVELVGIEAGELPVRRDARAGFTKHELEVLPPSCDVREVEKVFVDAAVFVVPERPVGLPCLQIPVDAAECSMGRG